jgi:hypothetical protein
MSLMPTTPGSIGGVVDHAIRLYVRTLVPVFPIVLIAVVLLGIPSLLMAQHMQQVATDPQAMLRNFMTGPVLLGYLAMMVVMTVTYGALFAQIDAIARGQRLSLGAAFGAGMRASPVLLGVGIVFTLMLFVGLVLLVIPGIYVWGVFQLAFVPPVLERAGVFSSLGISRRLIKGNWWRASVIVFVAFVIMYVLILVVGIITGVVAGFSGVAEAAAAGAQGDFLLVQQVISSVLNLFMMSFLPCVLLSVYYDLKLRNEGSDLAQRVGALNPAG